MSDYSFMQTGFNNVKSTGLSEEDIENIEILLSLFISNAISNASKYVTHCNRNGVTKEDIQYSLRYEVFEFLNRSTIMDDIKKATQEYNQYLDEVEDSDYEEDEDEINSMIIPDEEVNPFKRIEQSLICDNNKEFIEKYHKHNDNWDSWTPDTPLNKILKNAIDKINV